MSALALEERIAEIEAAAGRRITLVELRCEHMRRQLDALLEICEQNGSQTAAAVGEPEPRLRRALNDDTSDFESWERVQRRARELGGTRHQRLTVVRGDAS